MDTTVLDAALERFITHYPDAPNPKLCRTPGRINLLGEHLDYNGLPVLPMTIDRYLFLYYAPAKDGQIHLANMDSNYPSLAFAHSVSLPPSNAGAWENYVKAALQAINKAYDIQQPPGMYLLAHSNLPQAMGLSSSTALVVATALAYLDVLGKAPDDARSRLALAELLAEGEHYVGTRGGCMDQAILLLGAAEHALKIDFYPLRHTPAPLLRDHIFVVADSLERAEKSNSRRNTYNAGPLLCQLACRLLERAMTEQKGAPIALERLSMLWNDSLGLSDEAIADLMETTFPVSGLSLSAAAKRLGMPAPELRETIVPELAVEAQQPLPLFQRMRHQLTEYGRVLAGYEALHQSDAATFGQLMCASHASCRDDYEISTKALDSLVTACLEAGALGARLTGAGLGGAIIALIHREHFEAFRVQLISSYYRTRLGEATSYPVFAVRAGSSASYICD